MNILIDIKMQVSLILKAYSSRSNFSSIENFIMHFQSDPVPRELYSI